jgi:hypothetical protein
MMHRHETAGGGGHEPAVSGNFRLGMFGPRLGLSRLGLQRRSLLLAIGKSARVEGKCRIGRLLGAVFAKSSCVCGQNENIVGTTVDA